MLNDAHREMAAHYSPAVLPGRVRAPKDKASVETRLPTCLPGSSPNSGSDHHLVVGAQGRHHRAGGGLQCEAVPEAARVQSRRVEAEEQLLLTESPARLGDQHVGIGAPGGRGTSSGRGTTTRFPSPISAPRWTSTDPGSGDSGLQGHRTADQPPAAARGAATSTHQWDPPGCGNGPDGSARQR